MKPYVALGDLLGFAACVTVVATYWRYIDSYAHKVVLGTLLAIAFCGLAVVEYLILTKNGIVPFIASINYSSIVLFVVAMTRIFTNMHLRLRKRLER